MASFECGHWARAALVALLAGALGCNFLEKGGNSGSGRFAVVPATDLAATAWLPITVQDYEITGSTTGDIGFRLRDPAPDPNVAKVRSSNTRGELVIDAVSDGTTTLAFRATADGDGLDDDYTLTVRTAVRLVLSACDARGVFVRGMDAAVPYQLFAAESKPVKGLGLYPVEVLPATAASLVPASSDAAVWVFNVSTTAPDVAELRSTFPGDDGHLAMSVVDASEVGTVLPPSFPSSPRQGGTATINIVPAAGDRRVCSRLRKTIRSLTPGICRLVVDGHDLDSLDTVLETVDVHFIAQGACQLAVTLVDLGLDLGLGSVTVLPPAPKSSGHKGHDWDD